MKYLICLAALLWAGMKLTAADNVKEVEIKIIETSDVHGNFFPYNFIERKEWNGSLARVYSYVKEQRKLYGDNCILVDNGDILQGQPTAPRYKTSWGMQWAIWETMMLKPDMLFMTVG